MENLDNDKIVAGIHQPEYMPWLGFIHKVLHSDIFIILDNVPFRKNYFQNRNRIRTAGEFIWLTVPVLTKNRSGQLIKDVEINPRGNWNEKQVQSIKTCYSKAKYFNELFPKLEDVLVRFWEKLCPLNIEIIKLLLNEFNIETEIRIASEMNVSGRSSELLVNICREVGADVYLSGRFGKDYLDENLFRVAGIEVVYQEFVHPEYRQTYPRFYPDMSSIDLLFNYGDNSLALLQSGEDNHGR